MRSDRKVIILDNIKSDCIEQAMFILKDTRPENIDAVKEAERIIQNYTKKYHYTIYPKMIKKRNFSWTSFAAVLGSVVFVGVACAIWFIWKGHTA